MGSLFCVVGMNGKNGGNAAATDRQETTTSVQDHGSDLDRLNVALPGWEGKDYEYRVQTSETMIDLVAIRLMLNRIALHETFQTPS